MWVEREAQGDVKTDESEEDKTEDKAHIPSSECQQVGREIERSRTKANARR
jgi:hypothetical protein